MHTNTITNSVCYKLLNTAWHHGIAEHSADHALITDEGKIPGIKVYMPHRVDSA